MLKASVKTSVNVTVNDGSVWIDDEFYDGIVPPPGTPDEKVLEVVSTLLTRYGLSELHASLPDDWVL